MDVSVGSYDGVADGCNDVVDADGMVEGERDGTNDEILDDCANDGGEL